MMPKLPKGRFKMNDFKPTALPCISFDKIYTKNIESRIKDIDIFLKTSTPPYCVDNIGKLLHIELDELCSIIEKQNITTLNIISFFTIIQSSSSYICQLIQREWKYNSIEQYTPEMIAYIYDLNLHKVRLAFKESGLDKVTTSNIKQLFRYIEVPMMNL